MSSSEPAGPPVDAKGRPLRKLFEVWTSADGPSTGYLVAVFFHQNPGARETVESLARRLGLSEDSIRDTVAEQVAAGLLEERDAEGKTILLYDRGKRDEVAELLAELLKQVADPAAKKHGDASG